MKIVSLSAIAPEPWRNGGGHTRPLVAWPDAAAWQLRVSVAHIGQDGPFSAFPGLVRHFAVLAGGGVALSWQDHVAQLTPRSEPLAFDGGDPPLCRLLAGATEDLNLMTRADIGTSHLQRAIPGRAWKPAARWRGLYTHEAALLESAGSEWPLPAGTLVWSDSPDDTAWTLHAAHAGHAFWMWLELGRP
jgi:uncharacterized protein